eukprot:Platyproteum_vivax@DN7300_c0_g1_i4.p1
MWQAIITNVWDVTPHKVFRGTVKKGYLKVLKQRNRRHRPATYEEETGLAENYGTNRGVVSKYSNAIWDVIVNHLEGRTSVFTSSFFLYFGERVFDNRASWASGQVVRSGKALCAIAMNVISTKRTPRLMDDALEGDPFLEQVSDDMQPILDPGVNRFFVFSAYAKARAIRLHSKKLDAYFKTRLQNRLEKVGKEFDFSHEDTVSDEWVIGVMDEPNQEGNDVIFLRKIPGNTNSLYAIKIELTLKRYYQSQGFDVYEGEDPESLANKPIKIQPTDTSNTAQPKKITTTV